VSDFFTLQDLTNWQEKGESLHPPARLAVIGDPIGHSKSPQMHNPALKEIGLDGQYIRVLVPKGTVELSLRQLAQMGIIGINVTIPHKFEALDAVDEVDPLARRLGAVNTVAVREGRLFGFNSDGPGFLRSVEEAFSADVSELRILVLGAGGGAGRAVSVQCALGGCPQLFLVNRTEEKSRALKAEIQSFDGSTVVKAVSWNATSLRDVLPNVDLIVNGTSLGMNDEDEPLLPAGSLTERHAVFDMVYRPGGKLTSLGQACASARARYTDGRTLLLHQGAISFEYWFQRPAPIEIMRKGLTEALLTQ
jgi:shikimate dehydrogenase